MQNLSIDRHRQDPQDSLGSGATRRTSCRACGFDLGATVLDFGPMALANSYLPADGDATPEPRFPLHARVCEQCWLVQLDHDVAPKQMFSDYAYFSSWSVSWVEHARAFVEAAVRRLAPRQVLEIASNDGYLLQHFDRASVAVLGVEPAENVAAVARSRGIPTDVAFFGSEYATRYVRTHGEADLLVANNVLAHVPDLPDFVQGIATAIGSNGVASIEVPHLLELVSGLAFDTIYHEHFSYFSLIALLPLFARYELAVHDVEQLSTHGGSIRLWISRADQPRWDGHDRVARMCELEVLARLDDVAGFTRFRHDVDRACAEAVSYIRAARRDGARVVGYGAAAKGNTFLGFCGLGTDDLEYVADVSTAKQGRRLPGTHIPVVSPEELLADRPDLVVILAWNLRDEILEQLAPLRSTGTRFVLALPRMEIL